MNYLIVYYSLEGNTEFVAEEIRTRIGADVLRLVPKKAYKDKGIAKFIWGGKSAVMAEKPELEEYSTDLASVQHVIFGFPVWASTFAPPLRTFILDHAEALQGKTFSAFACQGGSGAEKAFSKLAKTLGIDAFAHTAVFINPKSKSKEETSPAIEAFCTEISS